MGHTETYLRRWLGAATLRAATFEDVEADGGSAVQAAVTVVLGSVAVGVAMDGASDVAGLVLLSGVALLAWASWAVVTLGIGVQLLPEPTTRADAGQLLRTLGFAATPALFAVCALLPGARVAVLSVTALWLLLAMFVAVRQALDYASTGRAIAVCIIGWGLALAMVFGAGFFLGTPVAEEGRRSQPINSDPVINAAMAPSVTTVRTR